MAMDGRDWYRDLVRRRTGYVERADFRISAPAPLDPPTRALTRRPASTARSPIGYLGSLHDKPETPRKPPLHPLWRSLFWILLFVLVAAVIKTLRS